MQNLQRKKLYTVALLSVFILNFGVKAAFSVDNKTKNNQEDKKHTSVDKIMPDAVKTLDNKTYDDAITIKDIEITGNHLVKAEDILKNLSLKKGSTFDKTAIKDDLKSIYEMGYFTEKIKAVPQTSPSGIKLKIQVEENVPVTGVAISGNTVVPTNELNAVFKDQLGLPQNTNDLNKAIQQVEDLYSQKGYILARVKDISDDPDGVINLRINEGLIDKVKVSGNNRTRDFVIRRNILASPGQVYNDESVSNDLQRLMASRAFSDVQRVVTPSESNPDKFDLTIEVKEKKTGSISLGGGVDTSSGLFGSVGYVDSNLMGRGQELSLNSIIGSGVVLRDSDMVRRPSFQFEAKFLEPRLKQSLTSLEVSAFGRNFASYQVPLAIERRFGGNIEFARPIKKIPGLAVSMNMGTEYVKAKEGDYDKIAAVYQSKGIDIARRAEQLQSGTYLSLGPSFYYDTRNRLVNTTNGWYIVGGVSENLAISGDAGTYTKGEIGIRRYYPVGDKSTFTIGIKGGSKLVGEMPEFAAFRLGGSSTVRGFREGDAGNGRGYMLGTAEFRTPIPMMDKYTKINFFRDMRLATFVDAGTLFRETITNTLYDRPGYGISAGAGLRVNVPMLGSVKIDYAYPLTFVGAGHKKKARFTFGLGDRF